MNKERRKAAQEIMDQLEALSEQLETLKEEEETCRDNIPENLSGSETYERSDEAIAQMEDALGAIMEAAEYLEVVCMQN